MTKTETALRVIAGAGPPWVQWKVFFGDELRPERDKTLESVGQYHDRISALVRIETCRWLAGRLDRQSEPWTGLTDSEPMGPEGVIG